MPETLKGEQVAAVQARTAGAGRMQGMTEDEWLVGLRLCLTIGKDASDSWYRYNRDKLDVGKVLDVLFEGKSSPFTSRGPSKETMEKARKLWQVENSPLAKALK